MPKISIIVPVYNMQSYLRECMESLIGQTFRDIEIICVNDGSTDDSPDILAEYEAADARVKVLTQENGGLSAARNAGLAAATAPLIMFCDSDDWYAPAMCEKMYVAMQGNAEIAICGMQDITDLRWKRRAGVIFDRYDVGEVDANDTILIQISWCAPNKIFRRSISESKGLRFPDDLYFEDAYFFAVYTAYVRRIAFVPDVLYYRRKRATGIMGRVAGGKAGYVVDHIHIANRIWLYHEEHDLVKRRLPYLVDAWFKLCSAALTPSTSLAECADREETIIAFAGAHIIPCKGLSSVARKRLSLLEGHRWAGLHKHLGGLILSRCKEIVTSKGYIIKRRYYWMGILVRKHCEMLIRNDA